MFHKVLEIVKRKRLEKVIKRNKEEIKRKKEEIKRKDDNLNNAIKETQNVKLKIQELNVKVEKHEEKEEENKEAQNELKLELQEVQNELAVYKKMDATDDLREKIYHRDFNDSLYGMCPCCGHRLSPFKKGKKKWTPSLGHIMPESKYVNPNTGESYVNFEI